MAVSLDDLYPTRESRWWRYRNEWHLGWADHELGWIAEGRPFPERWEYHRAGTRWADVTYPQVRECCAAGHPNTGFYVWISEHGGYRQVVETCEDCGEKLNGAVGTRRLKAMGLDRNTVPVANSGIETREICAKCSSDDHVEYHHWAPRHLFDDANQWPGDYLCRTCHQRWHRIATPDMGRTKKAKPVSQWLSELVDREAAS